MPTLDWQEVVNRTLKGRNKANAGERSELIRRRPKEPRKYRFVIPVATSNCKMIHASLSLICPRSERQLDPRIHHQIIDLLADEYTDGFYEKFITFEQSDAISRAIREENQYFATCRNPAQEFSHPMMARAYLDIINESTEHGECDEKKESVLRRTLLLPDSNRKSSRFDNLYAGANLPANVPGLDFPSILHRDLISHPLFRKGKWRIQKYTMATFLASGKLQYADEQTRRLFWEWLRHNEHSIGSPERIKLADIPIWPDTVRNFHTLSSLCRPRSRRIASILGNSIHRPHDHVSRLKMTTSGKKRGTSIRRIPSLAEIGDWLDKRLKPFVVGDIPSANTSVALKCLESDLTVLMKDRDMARVLEARKIALPCLAQDGSIRLRKELVTPSDNVRRLALLSRFLLKRNRRAATLDKLSVPLSEPTVDMLVSTFGEDCANFNALRARLRQFVALTKYSPDERLRLAWKPILPVQGQTCAPRNLALKGRKGDFWGDWKIAIPVKDLSQDDQQRYLDIGVTSASPTWETSRQFFKWLAHQNTSIIEQHIVCVFRHILHSNGPVNWAENYSKIPFVPVNNCDKLRIVSLHDARHLPVYIPDTTDKLEEKILDQDRSVFLVIIHIKEINDPISERLHKLGIKSLRENIEEPECVTGKNDLQAAPQSFLRRFARLHEPSFQNTFLKRLDELDVKNDVVRNDWRIRLSQIKEIRLAEIVEALYRFRSKSYWVPVDAGFDPVSSTFWIKRGSEDNLSGFYEAIAKQLVFKTGTRRIELLALEKALSLEIDYPSYKHVNTVMGDLENGGTEQYEKEETDNDDPEPGEAVFGHSPFTPDSTRNIPKPRPIPSTPATPVFPSQSRSGIYADNGSGSREPTPGIEKQHIEELKLRHYASHCQICLCKQLPQELAPIRSYIESEEVRRRVVEAHHVTPKSAGGVRHAGNLILLCKLHHDNYGRRFTREAVIDALRREIRSETIHFGEVGSNYGEIKGRIIQIELSDTGDDIDIFFTEDHADYWISSAS